MSPALDAFLKTWRGSAGNERAKFQPFMRGCVPLVEPNPFNTLGVWRMGRGLLESR